MSMARKDQTTNAGGKQKISGCPNQACKQLTQNEKQKSWNHPPKPKRWPTCKHKMEKKTKTKQQPPNHNSLTDYCLQQMTGQLQSKP